MTYTEVEQEIIVLNAAWTMIDDMVNFSIFMPLGERRHETNLLPTTSGTLRLFHLLLGDFLSPLTSRGPSPLPFHLPRPPTSGSTSDFTFLFYLKQIAADPKLAPHAKDLQSKVAAFSNWLEQTSFVERVWFPSIQVEVDLTVERRTWIRICADIAKHSFARLETNVSKIVRILNEHGSYVDEGMGYVVLPEFWDWFHSHLFAYHASTIAEFLNEIRWAIFEYLQPELTRSYHPTELVSGLQMYEFLAPAGVTSPLAVRMHWDLMNMVRAGPYFPRFSVTPSLKKQF